MANPRRPAQPPQGQAAFDLRSYRRPKGYVRVSTDEQAEEGTSIEVQVQQLRRFAAAHGFTLADADLYVEDGWSGKDLERPAMARLRADARAGRVDCLLVTRLDRLSRSLRDTVNLCLGEWQEDAPPGCRVVLKSILEPFDTCTDFGRMVFALLAMFAEFERRRIADRTWSGKVSRAEAGRNAGQRAPYGLRLVAAPEGRGSCFAAHPDEAGVVRRMAALYLGGAGYRQIAALLNEEGLRTRCGCLWQARSVARVLSNPLVAGLYAYGRTTISTGSGRRRLPEDQWVWSRGGQPEPIVSPTAFAAIGRLRESRRRCGRRPASASLLSGLVRCGRCGAACGVKTSGPQGRYRYYRCLRREGAGARSCSQPPVRADHLDGQLLAAVRAVLAAAGPAVAEQVQADARRQRAGLERSLTELAAAGQQVAGLRRRYYRWLEAGQVRPEAVQERLDELARQEQALAEERPRLEARLAALEPGRAAVPAFAGLWAALTLPERRQLLGALVRQVEVDGRNLRVTWRHDALRVEFAPTAPKTQPPPG